MRSRNLSIDNSIGKIYSNITTINNQVIASPAMGSVILSSVYANALNNTNLGGNGYYFSNQSRIKDITISFNKSPIGAEIIITLKKTSNQNSAYSSAVTFYSAVYSIPTEIVAPIAVTNTPSQKLILLPGDFLFLDTAVAKLNSKYTTAGVIMKVNVSYYSG